LFGRLACSHLFLKICECLDVEEGCDIGHKEVIQPVGLIGIEGGFSPRAVVHARTETKRLTGMPVSPKKIIAKKWLSVLLIEPSMLDEGLDERFR
jgi:hypothetical protein